VGWQGGPGGRVVVQGYWVEAKRKTVSQAHTLKEGLVDDITFEEMLLNRLAKSKEVLGVKAREYVRDGDRLSNFKRSGEILRVSNERALLGCWVKHVTSIIDMIEDLDCERRWPESMWEEKIGDAINYLILLEALVKERGSLAIAKPCEELCHDHPFPKNPVWD
jgi:hypothetical protein